MEVPLIFYLKKKKKKVEEEEEEEKILWLNSFIHWLNKKLHIWKKIENLPALGPSYNLPKYMAFCPSYILPKIKKVKTRLDLLNQNPKSGG